MTQRRLVATLLTAAVVAVAFVFVLPRVADLGDAWAIVRDLPADAVTGLAALTVLNLLAYPLLSMASLPGLRPWPAFVVTQASTAVANTVPAGSGVGIGVTYAMYDGYGLPHAPIALSITVTGVANTAVRLGLPAAAAALLALSGDAPRWAWDAARLGLVLALLAAFGIVAAVHGRRFALAPVRAGARLVARLRGRDPQAAARVVTEWLAGLRHDADALRGGRGLAIGATALLGHLAAYALFVACLEATGNDLGVALSFAVFAVVRLGLTVPVTPGGVGVAEAGYAAALVAAGAAADPAVAAVLLFRAASYLVPIPVGLACWLAFRRRRVTTLAAWS
ncbi:MAG TPA: lysylphosphatidylglycerol synthase domain-containing protein [Mycobacteriales bacterium]